MIPQVVVNPSTPDHIAQLVTSEQVATLDLNTGSITVVSRTLNEKAGAWDRTDRKPIIFKSGDYWYASWFNGDGFVFRRCFIWSIAVEQLCRLYAMGDVIR